LPIKYANYKILFRKFNYFLILEQKNIKKLIKNILINFSLKIKWVLLSNNN